MMQTCIFNFQPPYISKSVDINANATNPACNCNRTVAASRLKNTNLLLVVSQSDSDCDLPSSFGCPVERVARDPVEDADSGHAVCNADSGVRLEPLFRRRPRNCYESGATDENGPLKKVTDCSSGAASSPSLTFVDFLRFTVFSTFAAIITFSTA